MIKKQDLLKKKLSICVALAAFSLAGCEVDYSSGEESEFVEQSDSNDDSKTGNTDPSNGNNAPTVFSQTLSLDTGTSTNISLTGNDRDNDLLTYSILTQPRHGELIGELPNIVYRSSNEFTGEDSFTFKANDGTVNSDVGVITLRVNPVADNQSVKVFLMAGQSNMEGHNAKVERLEELVCYADSNFDLDGKQCGSYDIDQETIQSLFTNQDAPLKNYQNPYSGDQNDAVSTKLGDFLCKVGQLNDLSCSDEFDLTDRIFATVSGYYYNGSKYAYGNDAYKQMSASMGVAQAATDGILNSNGLKPREDVNVIQYQGSLRNGSLSFATRKGALIPDFGVKSNMYGPEYTFGHYMGNHLSNDILLLKVVQGGTSLRVDWKTPCSTQNVGNQLTAEELQQPSLYDALIDNATNILNPETAAELFPEYEGKTLEIAGFVWFQGWNDGLNDLNRDNYETNMKCLVEDIRKDLNMPELPIVISQSHVGDLTNGVQVGQKNVAEQTQNTNLSITDDLSGYYHFDAAAHITIGQRMAEAMKPMISQ